MQKIYQIIQCEYRFRNVTVILTIFWRPFLSQKWWNSVKFWDRNSSGLDDKIVLKFNYILVGFLFQIILELFSEGIEHGHVHVHHHPHAAFPLSIMLGLCIHSFFEGMPLAQRNGEVFNTGLFAGILLHHLPVAFALMSLLIASGLSKTKSLFNLFIFALMAPLGAWASQFIASGFGANEVYFDKVMGVVIGIFLHISTTILFESSEQHRFNYYKMGAILAGVGLALMIF